MEIILNSSRAGLLDSAEVDGLNEAATVKKYTEIVTRKLEAAYPDASIAVNVGMMDLVEVRNGGADIGRVSDAVLAMGHDVWSTFDWIVTV